jgi:hypothetical protein
MRTPTALLAALLGAFSWSSAAHAGGVGLLANTGFRQDLAYYYRDDGEQGVDRQVRPTNGFGFELLLGDRDKKVQGLVRAYTLIDAPLLAPEIAEEEGHEYSYPAYDELGNRYTGTATVGIQWGVYGDPSKFQVIVTSLMGGGIATPDNLEFLIVEPGAGVTYAFNDRLQLAGTFAVMGRYRKQLTVGGNAYVGLRYMFD